jgi:molybdopterin-guanine dinucleotide biosynthesis protein A
LSGVPKGLLLRGGRPLVEHLLDLTPLIAEVTLVANEPEPYARFGLRTVTDVIPGRGAPGGVHAALVHARTEWVLAVACDMPFVTRAVAELIIGATGQDVDIVACEVNNRLEPLLAVYRSALAGQWGAALESNPSFRQLYRQFRVRLLAEQALRAVDGDMRATVSINTPDDLRRFGVEPPHSP